MPATIPCAAWCGARVDERRASIGILGAQDFTLCVDCNRANLTPPPERATRANATHDPHGHYLQGVA